jgi:polar amino acid transport system substrate-binding protein
MFHGRRAVLLSIFVFAWGAVVAARAADTPVLRIRADSWMPFNGDPAAEKPGYVVELLREVFEPQGIKVEYQTMPWADALKAAEAGKIEGVIGANHTEAAHLVTGAEAIAEPKFALFVRRDFAWKYESLRSLPKIRLGAIEGYNYWESIDGYIKQAHPPQLTLYTGETPLVQALADLSSGKIDVMVESVLVFYWAAKSAGRPAAAFRIAYSQQSEPLYVAFSPTSEGREYARRFDLGLKELRERGRFGQLLQKYGLNEK